MSAINWSQVQDEVTRLHATAKDGEMKVGDEVYTFRFDRPMGHYVVTDAGGSEVMRINSRRLADAKKFLRHWLSN